MKGKLFGRIKKFFQEVGLEMKKVSWTSREQLIASTSVVAVVTLLIAIFIFSVDMPLSRLIEFILKIGM